MINYLKNKITKNLSNIPGWISDKKIIVLESDDWGSIRMSSRASIKSLIKEKIPIQNNHYNLNDCLECNNDLESLFDLLLKYKDSSDRNPVFSGLNIVANPDFERIRDSDYNEYFYESFTKTYSKYPDHDRVFDLYKYGIKERIFYPNFHGREHLNVLHWMNSLKKDKITKLAFYHNITCVSQYIKKNKINFQSAFDLLDKNEISNHKEIIRSGLKLFEREFGLKSTYFLPTNGPFNIELENELSNLGIKFLGTSKIHNSPEGNNKSRRYFRYNGMRSNNLLFLTRNVVFEPCSFEYPENKDWVRDALNDIDIAFKWRKPATISTHRVNYVGWLNPKNRSKGLKCLDELLKNILKKWPDVIFLTTVELGELILKSYKT